MAALAVALFVPSVAHARCAGSDDARWLASQSLVLLLNPMGAEHNARVGLCHPLYDTDDPVLSLNHVEGGVSTYLSPVYFVPGLYVQVAPVSFWLVRAETHALTVWPIPLGGAGFYERDNYQQEWNRDDLPVEDGGGAVGWSARLFNLLRFRVPITESVALLALAATWMEINLLDRGDYWVDVRDDVIAANGDWVVANEGIVMLQATFPDGFGLRFGAYSALRSVPAAGYVGHQVGPIAMLSFGRVDTLVSGIGIFARLGIYTHHRFRRGQAATMLGVSVDWDMGGL